MYFNPCNLFPQISALAAYFNFQIFPFHLSQTLLNFRHCGDIMNNFDSYDNFHSGC